MNESVVGDAADLPLALEGDHGAFERIFRRHAPRVHALAEWLGQGHAADDLTQEIFVLVWRRLSSYNSRSSLGTWIHRVAINVILSAHRAERSSEQRAEDAPPAGPSGISMEERVDLDDAITQLTAELRHVFVLHDVEGYRHDEIARLLSIPAGTSASRLHRARHALRIALNGNR